MVSNLITRPVSLGLLPVFGGFLSMVFLNGIVVKGSYGALAHEVGYANIYDTRPARDSIERLWKVSIIVQNGKKRQGFRLLSRYTCDEKNGKPFVALNPLITCAVMGGQRIRIDMAEVRLRLYGWIDAGKSGRVALDTLCGYVWPEEVTNVKAIKKCRPTARKARGELAAAGWKLCEYSKGKWEIGRPRALDKGTPPTLTALDSHVFSTQPHVNCTQPILKGPVKARFFKQFSNSIQDSLGSPSCARSAAP